MSYFRQDVNLIIEDILKRSEKARESNNVLLANVLRVLNPEIPRSVLEYIACKCPPIESITRKKRTLQSEKAEIEGKKAERLKREKAVQEELGY